MSRRARSFALSTRRWIVAGVFAAAVVPQRMGMVFAWPAVGRLPDALLVRLDHPDPRVRRGAARELGRLPPELVRPMEDRGVVTCRLLGSLSHETDRSAGLAMVGALAAHIWPDSPEALRAIVGGLMHRGERSTCAELDLDPRLEQRRVFREEFRAAALQALGTFGDGDEAALSPMLDALSTDSAAQPPERVSEAAVAALAELPDYALNAAMVRATAVPGLRAGVLHALGLRGDPVLGGGLASLVTLPPRPWTLTAIDAIARLRLTDSTGRLVEIATQPATSPDGLQVRRAAVRALGALGGSFDTAVVRDAIADPSLREPSLAAAGELGDADLVPAIVPLLASAWSVDRLQAAEALGALGSSGALQALAARIDHESEANVRRAIFRAIARIGGREAVRVLAGAADDPEARWALVEMAMQGQSIPTVRGDDASAQVTRALAGAGADARGLVSASADVRVATALALGAACTGGGALASALGREDHEGARVAMVLALGRSTPSAEASGALALLLEREADEPSSAAVVAASIAGRRGLRNTTPALRRMLRSDWAVARAEAAKALGMLADASSRGAIEEIVAMDGDADARGAAALSLAALAGENASVALRVATSTAWTRPLRAMLARAAIAARTGTLPWTESRTVTRVADAPPGSVWSVARVDGGRAYGVATADGQVMVIGALIDGAVAERMDDALRREPPREGSTVEVVGH